MKTTKRTRTTKITTLWKPIILLHYDKLPCVSKQCGKSNRNWDRKFVVFCLNISMSWCGLPMHCLLLVTFLKSKPESSLASTNADNLCQYIHTLTGLIWKSMINFNLEINYKYFVIMIICAFTIIYGMTCSLVSPLKPKWKIRNYKI